MVEYKFNLNNFKRYFEKFSYNFLKIMLLGITSSFIFLYLFYTTKDDTHLLLFLILLCGGLVCFVIILSHIDNVKRKNKNSILKINYNKNLLNEYKILKLADYNINSKNIKLYGCFENNVLGNLFNYQKYVSNINIPRQYENESDIISKLDIIKNNNIYKEDEYRFINSKINFIPLLVVSLVFIIMAFLGIFINNIILMFLSFILALVILGLITFLSIDHDNDSLLFKDSCIEYESTYRRNEGGYTTSISKYVNKYKISNITKIKKNRFFLTIYGNIDYHLYHVSKYKEENIDNSKIIKISKFKRIFIFNLFKEQEKLSKYISEYKLK